MKAYALVIGNNNYLYTKKTLDNAINDADAIAKKLSLLGFNVEKKRTVIHQFLLKRYHRSAILLKNQVLLYCFSQVTGCRLMGKIIFAI